MSRRAAVILCLALGCAGSQTAPPSTIPEQCRPRERIGPKLSDAQYQEAIALGATSSIAGHLAALLSDRPDDAAAQRSLAAALGEMGDASRSIAHYRCALSLAPMPDTRVELAAQLIHASAYADARAELLLAREAMPPDFRTRALMASALEGMGQLREAGDELAQAAEEMKTSAVLYRRAADLYSRAGDVAFAAELKAKADAIDPPPPPRDLRPLVEARSPKKKRKKK